MSPRRFKYVLTVFEQFISTYVKAANTFARYNNGWPSEKCPLKRMIFITCVRNTMR